MNLSKYAYDTTLLQRKNILAFVICIFLCSVGDCQIKGIDLKFYMSKPSAESLDDEFDYITGRVSPLFHLRVGTDLYAKKQRFITLHLGTVIGFENYHKPSIYKGLSSNALEDSLSVKKTNFFSFISLGTELKKSFRDNGKGIYLSVEPQFSFLISTRSNLLVKHNNVVVRDESSEFKDKLNTFNATLIFGAGYELGLTKRFNILLALNIEFRPIQGYYKAESHLWVSNGITAGVRYLIGKEE